MTLAMIRNIKLLLKTMIFELPKNAKSQVLCIKGKRACPPEDIGGVWVYNEILSELKDKSSDKFKELKTKYDKELIDFFGQI